MNRQKKILMLVAGVIIIGWLVLNLLTAATLQSLIMPFIFAIFWLAMWFGVVAKAQPTR